MKILIADDHNLVREGLRPFMEELDPNVTIVEAASFDEAYALADKTTGLDLILMDLKMPGMNGFDGLIKMCDTHTDTPVVILSGHFNRHDVLEAVERGAAGYVPKTISGSAMVNALRLVLSGEKYIPSAAFQDTPEDNDDSPIGRSANNAAPKDGPLSRLSDREKEILGHLIEGNTNKEIARKLGLQEITVKVHLRNIYRKMEAANRAQAVRIALQNGWQT
ncbi:Glycerol metabolism activator AgmR [Candidatus Terasakiella magnetica]|uniref:Glycerol metabolism activator AgmR n=1 Tax=Candidatus Terasakiella magnetica TaxID=1867952 RepID=A0A1C3RLG0_9PROT|nr:response regulator transcription factor [Candidatus Terasakiella magnetica]SCA58029.1 Glycerol metabolism activator AgmR [Candidatus Terasakiella magnetica]